MAEDKRRLSVTLTSPEDPRKTFTVPLKRFTPKSFDEWQDTDQDVKDSATRVLEHYRNDDPPAELEARLAWNREVRKALARERVVGTFTRLRSIIDVDAIKVETHRAWIESEPDSETWAALGNDLEECERALQSFRGLLGITE